MQIPKKISPDRIRDAIVEVRYLSKIPFEIIVGLFYNALDNTFKYTNRPITKQQYSQQHSISFQPTINFASLGQYIFYNDNIKIELRPNSIIFNCLNSYLGWNVYKLEINNVLTQLSTTIVIEKYNRIGLRYISEYANIDLQNCINFSFAFNMKEVKSDTYNFHTEFIYDELKVFLNLIKRNTVLIQHNTSSLTPLSIVDIDVIKDNFSILKDKQAELMDYIEFVHLKEKEIFFTLIKDDFLQTLNPEY